MRALVSTACCLGVASLTLAGDVAQQWARCQVVDAERVVVFEVHADNKLISRWTFPVKRWQVADLIRSTPPLPETRWFRAPDPFGKGEWISISSDTWLGSVQPEDAVVSFEWYDREDRSNEHRIAKEVFPVRFGKHESLNYGLVQLKASYLPAQARAQQLSEPSK